jgi:hypothetical protein
MKRTLGAILLAAGTLLTGCATSWVVDSDVRTFSSLRAVPTGGAAFRFERLPSQQSYGEQQAQVEAMVQQSLSKVGFRRDDAAAKYAVQTGARVQRERSPWDDPWGGWGFPGRDYVVTGTGHVIPLSPFPRMEQPWYRREVSIIIRDLGNNQVVYETHAAHDGPWADSAAVLPVMFDAALQGFPNAPPGVRKVNVTISPAK